MIVGVPWTMNDDDHHDPPPAFPFDFPFPLGVTIFWDPAIKKSPIPLIPMQANKIVAARHSPYASRANKARPKHNSRTANR